MSDTATLLLTDLYQLNMIKTYLDHDQVKTAVFEFFVRKLPTRRGFLVAAGLEQALDFLENFQFSAEELHWLDRTGRFGRDLLAHLESFRFTGEVHAMPEGTVFFANEPILRVTAPLPEAQLAETRIKHPALPISDCVEGGANDPGSARQATRRFRPATRARRRGRVAGGASELYCGVCRHRDPAG